MVAEFLDTSAGCEPVFCRIRWLQCMRRSRDQIDPLASLVLPAYDLVYDIASLCGQTHVYCIIVPVDLLLYQINALRVYDSNTLVCILVVVVPGLVASTPGAARGGGGVKRNRYNVVRT